MLPAEPSRVRAGCLLRHVALLGYSKTMTEAFLWTLGAIGILAVSVYFLRNANRILEATIVMGKLTNVRGHAPRRLLQDLEDVANERPVRRGTIRVELRHTLPFLVARGDVTERELQRMRNVLGTHKLASLRAAPRR
jgi:hypothetical protein